MADENHFKTVFAVPHDFQVYLGNQRAGRIEDSQIT